MEKIFKKAYETCKKADVEVFMKYLNTVNPNTELYKIGVRLANDLFLQACSLGKLETVEYLCPCIDINTTATNGSTPLMMAYEHIEVVDFLLKQKGIDINIQNSLGYTALMYFTKHAKIMKLLLKRPEIELNTTDENGDSAFLWCAGFNRIESAKVLMKTKGVLFDIKNNNGHNALIVAYNDKYFKMVKLILAANVIDANGKLDNDCNRFLPMVVLDQRLDILKLVLKVPNIYVDIKHGNLKTSLDIAIEQENFDIIELLLNREDISPTEQNMDEIRRLYKKKS